METLALVILVVSICFGFVAIFFTTFGTLIIFLGSLLYAYLTGFAFLSLKDLVVLFTFYLCGEVLEYVLIIFGAKRFGASNAAVVGAFVGGIVGAIFGASLLGLGLILGTFMGIFLGAFLVELTIQKDLMRSLRAGAGGVLGRVGSVVSKLIIAVFMIGIIALKVVPNSF